MAGDWIKMRTDLIDDPSVISIASDTSLDEYGVVGRLQKLWSWADAHTTDGKVRGVTPEWVDRYVDCDGFFAAMRNCGWSDLDERGFVVFPNFARHNGDSAKRRMENALRRRKSRDSNTIPSPARQSRDESVTAEGQKRDKSGTKARREPDKDVTESATREEKRREEKRREECAPSADADTPADLLVLIDLWNSLPRSIVHSHARRDPPTDDVVRGWQRVQKHRDVREAFSDLHALVAAIRRASYCHGQSWFSLTWLFGKNRDGEWKAVKLVNGGYDDGKQATRADDPRGNVALARELLGGGDGGNGLGGSFWSEGVEGDG